MLPQIRFDWFLRKKNSTNVNPDNSMIENRKKGGMCAETEKFKVCRKSFKGLLGDTFLFNKDYKRRVCKTICATQNLFLLRQNFSLSNT